MSDWAVRGAGLSSATVHEAAGRVGALPSNIKPVAPHMRVLGPAFPVKSPPGDNLHLHHAIYAARAGDILVVDCGEGDEYGYWGEVMSVAAHAVSLGGLVITGGVRDSDKLGGLGFPVFAGNVCIAGTGKDPFGAGSLGEPVRIGAVDVAAGDIVLGDADGVVVIPAARFEGVLKQSRARDAAELGYFERLRAGETTLQIYNLPPLGGSEMSGRRSIEPEGLAHPGLPIPAACRVGPLLATGGIRGVDRETGQMPADITAQVELMFANLKTLIEAGGGDLSAVVKVTVWVAAPEYRAALNPAWIECFPDPTSRPARHTLVYDLPGGMLVQCDALAWIGA